MIEPGMEPGKSIERGARKGKISGTAIAIIVIILLAGVGVAAYVALSPPPVQEIVRVDGSSTVYPITSAWQEGFNSPTRTATVGVSGTGGGFQKFCRGEIDLSDASRPIRQSETDACTAAGISGITEFLVAYDGLSVLVDKDNSFVQNLTVKELCRIWTSNTSADACGGAGPHVTRWRQLRPSDPAWPDRDIVLAGPGTDSGTYDYFIEVILTPYKTPIVENFFKNENDNILVDFIANEPDSLGFFGYAYVVENTDKIRPVAIDDEKAANGAGPVLPSETTIKDGSYAPLSRPLYIYGHTQAPANFQQSLARTVVKDFLRYGFSAAGQDKVTQTGYVTLAASEIAAQVAKIPA